MAQTFLNEDLQILRKSKACRWPAFVAIPVIYVLSIGPFVKASHASHWLYGFRSVYEPVRWIAKNTGTDGYLAAYIALWHKEPA